MHWQCVVVLWGATSIWIVAEAKLFKNIFGNKEHLKHDFLELFGGWFDIINEAELDFRYFIAHDYDKNKKLDGLELLAAFTHEADHKNENSQDSDAPHEDDGHDLPLHEAESLIDDFFSKDDDNNDGFLDYREFTKVVKRYPALGEVLS